jgi:hypothetical protein
MLMTRPMLVLLRESFSKAHLTLSVVISHYLKGVPEDLADEVRVVKGNEKDYGVRESYASLRSLAPQNILFDISRPCVPSGCCALRKPPSRSTLSIKACSACVVMWLFRAPIIALKWKLSWNN